MPSARPALLFTCGLASLALLGGCRTNTSNADASTSSNADASTESGSLEAESGSEDGPILIFDSAPSDDDQGDPRSCDESALSECATPAEIAYPDCLASCPDSLLACDDAACVTACELTYSSAALACQDQHCTATSQALECVAGCWTDFSSCVGSPNCDLHACQWELGPCLTGCYQCVSPIELDFAYAGSCELLLPEPPGPLQLPFMLLRVDGQPELRVEDPETGCDEPLVGGIITGLRDPSISLCPAACEAFSLAEVIRLS